MERIRLKINGTGQICVTDLKRDGRLTAYLHQDLVQGQAATRRHGSEILIDVSLVGENVERQWFFS